MYHQLNKCNTLQRASLKAECWRMANEKKEANEDHDDPPTTEVETVPLGYLESLHVKLMHHGSIMVVLVAEGGVLRTKWVLNFSDYGCVTGASQLCMLRWKVYF